MVAARRRVGDLEIEQDLDFQRREWAVQRAGWVAMALLVLAALVGLTGSRPLQLTYARFDRLASPGALVVRVGAAAVAGEQFVIWLDQSYVEAVRIERISPEPVEVRAGGDRLSYVFAVAAPGQPLTIILELRHQRAGWRSGWIGLADGPSLRFGQLVYP